MKKSMMLFVLAFVTLFATESKAQINFGVKGGLNVTRMSFDESLIKEDNRCGFFFGPSVKFTLPVIGLGMDIAALYDQPVMALDLVMTQAFTFLQALSSVSMWAVRTRQSSRILPTGS